MDVLVDTSVWIDYFRSGKNSSKLDYLIDENLLVINNVILAELLPLLKIRRENEVTNLLTTIRNNPLKIDWQEIIEFQVCCLKTGSTGIGIPDLIIAQNAMQNKTPIYCLDKHFGFMQKAKLGIKLFS